MFKPIYVVLTGTLSPTRASISGFAVDPVYELVDKFNEFPAGSKVVAAGSLDRSDDDAWTLDLTAIESNDSGLPDGVRGLAAGMIFFNDEATLLLVDFSTAVTVVTTDALREGSFVAVAGELELVDEYPPWRLTVTSPVLTLEVPE